MSKPTDLDRRQLLTLTGALVVTGAMGCGKKTSADAASADAAPLAPEQPGIVRLASVKTAVEGNLLPELVADFERATKYRVELSVGEKVYDRARTGGVDVVISHYGHHDAEAFVLDGLGEWPRTIFSNQMALVGPPSDPAGIRALDDAGEAFRRIAATKSPYVLNYIDGVRYLTEILWNAAGKPDRAGWFHDEAQAKDAAIVRASELGAYSLWGLTPFLRLSSAREVHLEPLVLADPLLQRMLVSVVVKSGGGRRVNHDGAMAFQNHLLAPATQARIRSVHYPGAAHVSWVPAGRHNRTAILPKG